MLMAGLAFGDVHLRYPCATDRAMAPDKIHQLEGGVKWLVG